MSNQLIGFQSILWKEIRRFLRVWTQTLFSPVVNSALYMLVFGVSLGGVFKAQQGVQYLEFIIPGLIAMTALNNSLQNSASSIMISKFHNDLQDLKVIPVNSFLITIAYLCASLMRALACAFMVFLVGQVFMFLRYGSFLEIYSPLALVLFLTLGSLFFGCLGLWAGFKSSSFDQINAISQFIVLPLIYLGGVFYSLEILHPFWQSVAEMNPLVYLVNGVRWSMLGVSDISPLLCFNISFGFVVVGSYLAWRGVRYGNYFRF